MSKVFTSIRDYFVTAYLELQKVVWPSRNEVIRHTIIIAVSVVLASALLGLMDYGLTSLLRIIIVKG